MDKKSAVIPSEKKSANLSGGCQNKGRANLGRKSLSSPADYFASMPCQFKDGRERTSKRPYASWLIGIAFLSNRLWRKNQDGLRYVIAFLVMRVEGIRQS